MNEQAAFTRFLTRQDAIAPPLDFVVLGAALLTVGVWGIRATGDWDLFVRCGWIAVATIAVGAVVHRYCRDTFGRVFPDVEHDKSGHGSWWAVAGLSTLENFGRHTPRGWPSFLPFVAGAFFAGKTRREWPFRKHALILPIALLLKADAVFLAHLVSRHPGDLLARLATLRDAGLLVLENARRPRGGKYASLTIAGRDAVDRLGTVASA